MITWQWNKRGKGDFLGQYYTELKMRLRRLSLEVEEGVKVHIQPTYFLGSSGLSIGKRCLLGLVTGIK